MSFGGFLKQATAVDVKIGPFVDSTDGDTEETTLTIEDSDIQISKNGQTGVDKNDTTSAAHAEDGMYNCELDATDTDTVGQLTIGVHVTGALFVRMDFQVIEEAVYDRDYKAAATGVDADWTNAGRLDALLDLITAAGPTKAEMDTAHGLLATVAKQDIIDGNVDDIEGKFAGITLLNEWLGAIAGKQNADSTALTEIKATGAASGTYDPNTDSLEALNDVGVNLRALSGDATAADLLEAMMDGMVLVQVNDASATTTAFATNNQTGGDEATDDHFKGRLVTFITGNLARQQTDVVSYDASGGAQGSFEFTVTALTEAPANDDFFIVH